MFPLEQVVIMLVIDRENDRALLSRQSRFVPRMWSCLAGFIEVCTWPNLAPFQVWDTFVTKKKKGKERFEIPYDRSLNLPPTIIVVPSQKTKGFVVVNTKYVSFLFAKLMILYQ